LPPIQPWPYALVLAAAVGMGLPAGALVVGAGALFGPGIGLLTVLTGQALGLTINWRLCRGWLRQRVQRWVGRQRRGRRLQGLLEALLEAPASLRLLLLLRLALIPMNLVNAACALGPTPLRRYALASLMLVPRFSVLVYTGELLGEAASGSVGPAALAFRGVALVATAAVLVLLTRGLRR
jgi:uncharacterized membrane protein YdjX (TVP38/TMEM64 family)